MGLSLTFCISMLESVGFPLFHEEGEVGRCWPSSQLTFKKAEIGFSPSRTRPCKSCYRSLWLILMAF